MALSNLRHLEVLRGLGAGQRECIGIEIVDVSIWVWLLVLVLILVWLSVGCCIGSLVNCPALCIARGGVLCIGLSRH